MAAVDRLIYAAVIAGVLLASCAPTHQKVWLHPGYTPSMWARDSFECERMAQELGPVMGMPIGGGMVIGVPSGTSTDDRVLTRCLEARGWTLTYRQLP